MNPEDNNFNYFKYLKPIFNNDPTSHKNLSSNKDTFNNIQQNSYYLGGNSPKNENIKCSLIKDESEYENNRKIENILTKNNIMNSKSENNSTKNKMQKKKLIQDEAESYGDEKDSSHQDSESDNIKSEDLMIKEEITNEFPFYLNINKSSNFLMNNNSTQFKNKNGQINHENISINNINKESDKNNRWNFNLSPSKIFNYDNQKNQLNNNENRILNDNNIHVKIDVNSGKNNQMINNKVINNINEYFPKNEIFKLNQENAKINNKGFLENRNFFDRDMIEQKLNSFYNQNSYTNFNNNNNQLNQNIENIFINNNNKNMDKFFTQKDLNTNNFNQTIINESKEDINENKLNINRLNLNEDLNKINQEYPKNSNGNDNFNLYQNNKFIYYNSYINLINPIHQNKNINCDSHDSTNNINTISLGKDTDNLNQDNYLTIMFGKLGWICRLCNNFNFKTRNICNRCKALKTPKTIEEINMEKEIKKNQKKKIKEKRTDWLCLNCQNINYFFRKICNRCKIERKKEFPSIYLLHHENLKGKNKNNNNDNNTYLSKNINENGDINNNLNRNYLDSINTKI